MPRRTDADLSRHFYLAGREDGVWIHYTHLTYAWRKGRLVYRQTGIADPSWGTSTFDGAPEDIVYYTELSKRLVSMRIESNDV